MYPIIQLRVTLEDIKPPIWRRLILSSSATFYELHHIIQIAFGWENSHLFQFKTEDYFIGLPDPEFDISDNIKVIDAKDVILSKLFTETGDEIEYEYDFGDSWIHSVVMEKYLQIEPGFNYPSCLAGKRATPPENCGGVHGYHLLMETEGTKKHPEHKQYDALFGGKKTFDPEYFDIDKVNKRLTRLESYIKKTEE